MDCLDYRLAKYVTMSHVNKGWCCFEHNKISLNLVLTNTESGILPLSEEAHQVWLLDEIIKWLLMKGFQILFWTFFVVVYFGRFLKVQFHFLFSAEL